MPYKKMGEFDFYMKMGPVHALHENGANSILTFDIFRRISEARIERNLLSRKKLALYSISEKKDLNQLYLFQT